MFSGAFGGNTFGQPAAAQPSTSGFGAFGAPAATPSQQPTSTFGGFGANTTAQNGSSNIFGRPAVGFGAAATTAPAGSALFGGAGILLFTCYFLSLSSNAYIKPQQEQ
jgi:hypothetical protein